MSGDQPTAGLDVQAVRARCEEAWPDPWFTEQRRGDPDCLRIYGDGGETICDIDDLPGTAEFIAHARTDVPALLDALAAAIRRAEQAEAALARVKALDRPVNDRDHAMLCGHFGGGGCFRPSCSCWCHRNPEGVVSRTDLRAALATPEADR